MYCLKLFISSFNLLKSCLQLQCLCLCANKPKGAVNEGHVLKLRYPRCVCNSEVKGQSKSKHNWFIVWALKKRHVSAYSEAIIRLTKF